MMGEVAIPRSCVEFRVGTSPVPRIVEFATAGDRSQISSEKDCVLGVSESTSAMQRVSKVAHLGLGDLPAKVGNAEKPVGVVGEGQHHARPLVVGRNLRVSSRHDAQPPFDVRTLERSVHDVVEAPEPHASERSVDPEVSEAFELASLAVVEQRRQQVARSVAGVGSGTRVLDVVGELLVAFDAVLGNRLGRTVGGSTRDAMARRVEAPGSVTRAGFGAPRSWWRVPEPAVGIGPRREAGIEIANELDLDRKSVV